MAKTKIIELGNGYCVAKNGKTGFKIVNIHGDTYGYAFTKSDLNTIKRKKALLEKQAALLARAEKLHAEAHVLTRKADDLTDIERTFIGNCNHELTATEAGVQVGCTFVSNDVLAKIERL